MLEVNSKSYWDNRFKKDWQSNSGEMQSKYFAKMAIMHFPDWFIKYIQDNNSSILDWGCAEGDGTSILKESFNNNKIIGIDFSDIAINSAKRKFPEIEFIEKDLTIDNDKFDSKFDVIFTSNTLEHFNHPWEIFRKLSKYANEFLVILVPFREYERIEEHLSVFDFSTIPIFLEDFILTHSSIIPPSTSGESLCHWNTDEILLIYTRKKILPILQLSLSSTVIDTEKNNLRLFDKHKHEQHVLELQEINKLKEKHITNLENEISTCQTNVSRLDLAVNELTTEIIEKRIEIGENHNRLAQIELEKNNLTQEIGENHNRLAQIELEKNNLTQELDKIINSRRFKYTNALLKIFFKIIPRESSMFKLAKKACKPLLKVSRFTIHILKRISNKLQYIRNINTIKLSGLFNSKYYSSKVICNKVSPLDHFYVNHNNNPSTEFDTAYYKLINNDKKTGNNPLLSFINSEQYKNNKFQYKTEFNFDETKPTIVYQIDSFDKGGLEEVVLSIITNSTINKQYNIVVIVTTNSLGYLASKALAQGIAVISIQNNINALAYLIEKYNVAICHSHYSVVGMEVYHSNNIPIIYTVHNNYIWADDSFIENRKIKYKYVDQFIAVSNQVKKYFSQKFEVEINKIKVINNGVEISEINKYSKLSRSKFGLKKSDFVILNIASFIPNKFHLSMIEAMKTVVKKHKDVKLLFVGNIMDKEYFNNVKSLIQTNNLTSNVIILDYLPKHKLLGLLRVANTFLLPSLTEGFSISTIEAMYYELPLILSDIGGARDVIKDSDIGIITSNPYSNILDMNLDKIAKISTNVKYVTNTQSIVNAISNIYENRENWKNKAKLGKQKVVNYFNVERMVKEHIELYNTILLNNGGKQTQNTLQALLTKEPLVSIMMPVYNHKEFVGKAIDSIINQTYLNWELIILDDGSSDGLLDYLQQYIYDERIRIYTQPNQKLPTSLSHLHALARGEFLTWTSADNILEKEMVETLTKYLIENPKCSLCYADVSIIDENDNFISGPGYRDNERDKDRPYILRLPRDSSFLGLECDNYVNACFMYRKICSDLYDGLYDKELTGLEDYDFWLKLSRAGDIQHVCNSEPLYKYRVHNKTMSAELQTKKREEHLERLSKFFKYEKERQKNYSYYKNKIDNNAISKEINDKKHMSNYEIINVNSKKLTILKGVDIQLIAKRARDYNIVGNYWEYGVNPLKNNIIGIHFDLSKVDFTVLSKIMTHLSDCHFVICDSKDREININEKLQDNGNYLYLGSKELGQPYQLYSTWDAILIPPQYNNENCGLESYLLSLACGKWCLLTDENKYFDTLPFTTQVSNCKIDNNYIWSEIDPKNRRDILDRYIDYYSVISTEIRRNFYEVAVKVQKDTKRPTFSSVEIKEELPKLVKR